MRALSQWVGHVSKRPIHPRTGASAAVDDPSTWGTFEDAAAFYERTAEDPDAGVGFVFTAGSGLAFVDLDHVLSGVTPGPGGLTVTIDPRVPPEYRAAVRGITEDSYCEVSPSGTGVHVFGVGKLPPEAKHSRKWGKEKTDPGLEVYDHGRYSTVTGLRLGAAPLRGFQARLERIVEVVGQGTTTGEPQAAEPHRWEEAADALSHLDPDMDYHSWLKTGMALKAGLGKAGRALWLAWSAQGKKCKPGEPEEKWRSFSRTGVGLGSLFYMAHEAGWDSEGPRPTAEEEFGPYELRADEEPVDTGDELHLVTLDTVAPEKIDWLWKGRVALGHVTLVAGDPGKGKSIMTLDLSAKLSRGAALPGEPTGRTPARVLLLNVEDGQGDTIRPRAEAAGADLKRIVVLDLLHGGRAPQLPDDVERLEASIKRAGDVQMVVLDPLNACLPVKLDSHKDQHIRQALAPLAAMAQRLHIAILLVCHLNKTNDAASVLYRISGSVGLGAAARSVLFVGADPEDEDPTRRIVAQAKPQLGPAPRSLAFRVKGSAPDEDVGVVEWLGEVDMQADSMLSKPRPQDKSGATMNAACAWLTSRLSGGPVLASTVLAEGKGAGYSERTLQRAREQLGAVTAKVKNGWTWALGFTEQEQGARE
jgi:hypothetical protein